MARLTEKEKAEFAMYLSEYNRKRNSSFCNKCINDCKQGYKVSIIECLKYEPKPKANP